MPESYTVVLVDLDGTMVDSAAGITEDLAAAIAEAGVPVPPPARMLELVGPPILDGLRDVVGLEGAAAQEVLERYRGRYRVGGAFRAEVYDGMRETLTRLAGSYPLAVATSKPESIATRILEHFDLARIFTAIAGASDDEARSAKADVVERALELLQAAGADTARPVMVGDRHHDVTGAAAHGIPTILAGWGYGAPEEAAGAIASAAAPQDLPALIAGGPPS